MPLTSLNIETIDHETTSYHGCYQFDGRAYFVWAEDSKCALPYVISDDRRLVSMRHIRSNPQFFKVTERAVQ